jgi:rhamnulokinase
VVAGPVEAAALGNALVQARAGGLLTGALDGLRALIRATQDVRSYAPSAGAGWDRAEERVHP